VVLGGVVRSAGRIAGVAGSVTGGVASAACRTGVRTAETAVRLPLSTAGTALSATGSAFAATEAVLAAAPALVGLTPSPRRLVGEVVAAGTHLTARAATEAAQMPARTATVAVGMARHGRSTVEKAPLHAVGLAKALTDLHPRRTHRRVWENHGHAQIEVRGLTGDGPRHGRVAAGVRRALNGLSGVSWAEVNAITGQVLVAFDEGSVDVEKLLDTVRAVEAAHGTREEEFSWDRPVHPSDETPLGAAAVSLAADYVALTAAIAGRVVRVPPLPRGVRVTLTLLDLQPGLRRRLREHIGPVGTDVVMSLAYAGVSGLSQRPLTPAVDAIYRTELMAEALAQRSVWKHREPELYCSPESLPDRAPRRRPRPCPLPKGPLETWSDTLGPGSLAGAAGVLFLTKEPRRAADTILAAVPRAARLGRESFAATAARRLSHHGVVPLDASAYRRLDRVSAIVVDSSVLCTDRPQILTVEGERDDVRSVWRAASRLLRDVTMPALEDGTPLTDGTLRLQRDPRVKKAPPGAVPLVLRKGNRRLGRLNVGGELAPLAEALLDAARETGARVLTTEHAVVRELLPQTDEVLSASQPLGDHVRRLQEEGHGVLCISGTAEEALDAADVGVGVLADAGGCSAWSADLLCGPGLEDAWRVLGVMTAARPLTQRVVHVAQAATALGTLLALVGGRRRGGKTHALAPVHTSALLGLYQGARAGRGATRRRTPAPVVHIPWHALDPTEVLERLDELSAQTRDQGLSLHRAVRQLRGQARTFANKPVPRRVLSPATGTYALAAAVREELEDPLTPVLALGATASAIVGSAVDAVLVGTVLTGNAFVSGAQRWRAERSLNRLLVEQTVTAHRVRRSARDARDVLASAAQDPDRAQEALEALPLKKVRAPSLVLGDVVSLRAGDVVPADARLVAAWDLEVDESSLTGESVPVHKDVEATPGVPLPERRCMVFDGTTVLAGTAYAVVVATGGSTEAGRAARAAGRAAPAAGIQARLMEITRMALPATGVGGAGVAGLGLLRGLPLREAIAAGVSVAVAAVPEGLPLVATVAQAGAARRLSRQGVLVRSSRTLEALGRADTVCFDKTGTLTTGRLAVTLVRAGDDDLPPDDPAAKRTLTVAAHACPAVDDDEIDNVPHATDRAVLKAANGAVPDGWELRSEASFEASRGYAAALGTSNGSTETELAVKGAPEVVLPLCDSVVGQDGARPRRLDDHGRRTVEEAVQELADRGLRLLAVAERTSDLPDAADDLDPLVQDLTLVGLVGISDSPRDTAGEAVRRMVDAGIQPVMITGDHPATARAIAAQVGLPTEHVTTGAELEGMTEEERVRRAAQTTIFARVSPEQKVRIVEALRAAGRVVAMTGDGTNDAAAIRLADVGIGVGAAGSTAARSSADLVLAEPDLPRIHDALVEGRHMWHRMREAVSILVGGNAGEMGFMMLGTAVAGRAPINIRQMLVVNLLTDMFPALAVALAPSHSAEEAAEPVGATLGKPLARAVAIRGATTAFGATLAWTVGRYTGRGRRADTMGLAALVGTQLGQTLLIGWRSPLVVATTLASVGVLLLVVETPGVSQLFGCTPIGPFAWTVVIGSSAAGTGAAALAQRRFAHAS
jgi:cation-transporting ATPase I